MKQLVYFSQICEKYSAFADFVVIYIEEAHASDGWRFSNNYDINIHRTIKDRLEAANRLKDHNILPPYVPILVDSMEDGTNKSYAALFERIYVLQSNKVAYQGGLGPFNYNLEELDSWLANYEKNIK